MYKILKIGVLGCANIALRSIMPSIKFLYENFDLTGIASRDFVEAKIHAEQYFTRAYKSYQSLIDDADLDAVYIPLPNSLHAEWIKKALSKGINVLVEKSMACSYNEVLELNNLAKEKNLVLVENFQFRFHSQLQYIKNLIESGSIGQLRCMRSSFGFGGLPNENDIRYQKNLGGGALLDAGAYPLKISQIFLGNDIHVKASNINYLKDKEVDIWGGAYLKQNNGQLFSEIAYGFHNHYQCNVEFWGSEGKIFTNRIFTAKDDYTPIVELENKEGKQILELPEDDHFRNMLLHFYHLCISKENLENEYLQNINQARLIDELKMKSNE